MLRAKPNEPPNFSTPEELEALLLEGVNSGEPVDVTPEFWRSLDASLEQRQDPHRKAS